MQIIRCNGTDEAAFFAQLRSRSAAPDPKVVETVTQILDDVRRDGDKAVRAYTEKFDGKCPDCFEVDADTISDALEAADPKFVEALLNAIENISDFHNRQKEQGFCNTREDGVILGQRLRGLERVGLYVPGGTAAYPSSVLMNAIPAKIAGVRELMTTPPGKDGKPNPDILVAASLCGVDRVFLMGGAQAVAALAYGTDTVPRVDKIVGPGNIFVATAKRLLYGVVDIDMVAGPSEVLVMADDTADPKYVAADLMSQAEHDKLASAILVTTSERVANETLAEFERQMAYLERREIIKASLDNYGAVLICETPAQAVAIANEVAPEHLEVLMENPLEYIGKLDNAGSVFLGVLPTSGTARFFSPLSVYSFVKRSSYIYYTEEALRQAKDDIILVAKKEGLTAHANAIAVRFEGEE